VTSLIPAASDGSRPISYSTGAATYQSAYAVQITNSTSSNINNIFFSAITSVSNGMTAPFAPVTGLRTGDSCTLSLGGTRVDCQFVSLPSGSAPISLTLLVTSPQAPNTQPDSTLGVSWAIQAGQGNSNPSNFVHQGAQDVTLKVGSAKDGIQSYVLANSDLSASDTNAKTDVTPPTAVTIGVKQVISPSSCSPHYKPCFESTITIVDTSGNLVQFNGAPLVIDLFRAASTLKKNAKFANAQLFYTGADGITYTIPTCDASNTVPTAPPRRCITQAVTGNATTGQTGVSANGDWLFHILASENGIINW